MHKIYCQLKNIIVYKFFSFSYYSLFGNGDCFSFNKHLGNGYGFGYGFSSLYGLTSGYHESSRSEHGNGSLCNINYNFGCGNGYDDGDGEIYDEDLFLEETNNA